MPDKPPPSLPPQRVRAPAVTLLDDEETINVIPIIAQLRDRAVFTQMTGLEAGRVCDLEGVEITFGRAPTCTHSFDEASLSRVHARLVREGGAYVIEDAGSRNGIFVVENDLVIRSSKRDDTPRFDEEAGNPAVELNFGTAMPQGRDGRVDQRFRQALCRDARQTGVAALQQGLPQHRAEQAGQSLVRARIQGGDGKRLQHQPVKSLFALRLAFFARGWGLSHFDGAAKLLKRWLGKFYICSCGNTLMYHNVHTNVYYVVDTRGDSGLGMG